MKNQAFKILLIIGLSLSQLAGGTAVSFAQEETAYNVKDYLDELLPPQAGRRINFDETSGVLTVTDIPSNHKIIEDVIRLWDTPPRQVAIEARFVEIDITDLSEIGVEWTGEKTNDTYFGSGSESSPGSGSSPTKSGTTFRASSIAQAAGLGLYFGKTPISGSQLYVYLKALEEKKKANLLSSPQITTLSGQMANIQVTNTIPYITDVERENIGTEATPEWIETFDIAERVTGISLEVTPYLIDDDTILMEIHPVVEVLVDQINVLGGDVSVPDNLGWPIVDTRTSQTTVSVRSGETVVMGGLIKEDESEVVGKVPFLGDLPLIGGLFRHKYTSRQKRNLVIFITARIL